MHDVTTTSVKFANISLGEMPPHDVSSELHYMYWERNSKSMQFNKLAMTLSPTMVQYEVI